MNKKKTQEERKKIFYEQYNKAPDITKHYINELMTIKDDLFNNTHDSAFVRYCYCYALRKTNMTYKKIGKWFGLDHSTVIQGIDSIVHSAIIYGFMYLILKKIDNVYDKHYKGE